jgi:predicted aspartyl protease
MKRIVMLCAAALAAIAPATAAPPPPSCQLKQAASLEMNTETDGTIAIPVSVEDRPARLMVDTGSVYSSLTLAVVSQLGLKPLLARRTYEILGHVPMLTIVQPSSFRMGNLSTDSIGFYVLPSRAINLDLDGLLGPDIMSNYDVELDFAHARFNLFSQDHCPGQVVYWTQQPYAQVAMHVDDSWHISVPVTLDGKQIDAVVDTGSYRSSMDMALAKSLFGIDETNPALKSLGKQSVNGTAKVEMYRYPFQTLTLQDVEVRHPGIDLMPDGEFGKNAPQLILGMETLRQLHLYIAYKEQILYLTPAETVQTPATAPAATATQSKP